MTYWQVEDDEWTEPPRKRVFKLACCDCGLVHVMKFRVHKRSIQFQMRRDSRATGQVRRWGKLKCRVRDD